MNTYEMVTYRPEGTIKYRTVILENPKEVSLAGGKAITGRQVNRQGCTGSKDRIHIIETALILNRSPLQMNLRYGELEKI